MRTDSLQTPAKASFACARCVDRQGSRMGTGATVGPTADSRSPPPLPQDEVGLSHFCWYERDAAGAAAGEAEQDIVIIPGECTFSKVGHCKGTSCVAIS